MQTNLTDAISKKLEIERSIIEIENQVNQKKITHKELETNLSENERAVQNSLQSIDHLESLKAQRLAELQQADQNLSQAERKTLEVLRNRQNSQRVKCREINTLIGKLYKLYNEVILESSDIDACGFRRTFASCNSNSLDLPQVYSDRNIYSWLANLPAFIETKTDQIIFLSASDVESRGQKIF